MENQISHIRFFSFQPTNRGTSMIIIEIKDYNKLIINSDEDGVIHDTTIKLDYSFDSSNGFSVKYIRSENESYIFVFTQNQLIINQGTVIIRFNERNTNITAQSVKFYKSYELFTEDEWTKYTDYLNEQNISYVSETPISNGEYSTYGILYLFGYRVIVVKN